MPTDLIVTDPALATVCVQTWHAGVSTSGTDVVATEVPVALEYNGLAHAVMLATPQDLEDFALGFSLTEGILQRPADLFDCDIVERADGIALQLRIAGDCFAGLKDRRRSMTGRTGCGLCGAETLQQAIRQPSAVSSAAHFSATALRDGMAAMQQQQRLQQATGATHAAAWLDADGSVAYVREDVGRHNALDKLLGVLARAELDLSCGAVLLTSRASYEMVQKAATMGIGMLAAISAPTSLAVALAQRTQITLVGFMRAQHHVVYSHPQRLRESEST